MASFNRGSACVGMAAATSIIAMEAFAAERDPSALAVLDRKQPEYAARGIAAGGFMIYPNLTAAVLYDSNVFATRDPKSDRILVVRPEILAKSNWARHSFEAFASIEAQAFQKHDGEDKVDSRLSFDGRIDVQSDLHLLLRGSYAHVVEERGTGESFNPSDDPVEYDEYSAGATLRKGFNRLYTAFSYEFAGRDYQDTAFDQDFRDNDKHTGRGRLGYEISPMTSVFLEAAGNWQEYRNEALNSQGLRTVAGVALEPTRLMKGEIFIGHLRQDYDTYSNIETWTFGGHLEWYLTPFMTASFDAGRETDSTFGSSRLDTSLAARIDYEVRRNLVLSGLVTYDNESYQDFNREDDAFGGSVLAKYLVNPWLSIGAEYLYKTFESDLVDNYDRHRVGVNVTAQY